MSCAGSPSPAPTQQTYGRFEECPLLGLRYPNLTGLVLTQAIGKDYTICDNATVDLFSGDGNRLLRRHPLNNRDVQADTETLATSFENEGLFLKLLLCHLLLLALLILMIIEPFVLLMLFFLFVRRMVYLVV